MIRRAKDTQMPPGFDVFWGKVYDGGKKKVNNPNPKTRKTHPTISASTAMKYDVFREHVMQQFEDWKDSNKDEKEQKTPKRPTALYERLKKELAPSAWKALTEHPFFKDDPDKVFDLCGIGGLEKDILGEISSVDIRTSKDQRTLILDVDSSNIDLIRNIQFDYGGTPTSIHNNLFVFKNKTSSGAGSSMFSSQVEAAKQMGFKHIACEAAGSGRQEDNEDGYVGYYVWPILGYDSPLKPVTSSEKRNLEVFCEDNKVEMPKTVQELYAIPGGRAWWKEFGWGLKEAKFDLSEGSKSLEILRSYMEAKKAKGGSKKASKKPSKKMPKGWTDAPHIELDEEELNKIFQTKAIKTKKTADGKPSAQFLKFWEEVYGKGKKKVPNPNQATKKTHPEVSASTAMKTPAFQAKVKKEFKAWLQQQDKDKKSESKSEPKEPAKDNTVLQLDPSDLKDAFEHASEFLDEELDPDDFEISKPKRLSIKELAQYDDLSSWSEWGEGDLAEMDEDERREELENFRGDGFADRAEAWLKGGKFPPIVVVESEQGAVIGDGRGRASIAIGMGIPIDVVFARQKSKKASLSSLVLKVAQLNSHARKAFLHEIRKATRPMTRSEFQKAQLGTVIEVMPNSKAKEMAKQYGGGEPVPVLYVKVTDGWVKPDGFQPGGQRVVSIRFKKTPLDDSKFDLSLKEDCVFSLGVHELEGWF